MAEREINILMMDSNDEITFINSQELTEEESKKMIKLLNDGAFLRAYDWDFVTESMAKVIIEKLACHYILIVVLEGEYEDYGESVYRYYLFPLSAEDGEAAKRDLRED